LKTKKKIPRVMMTTKQMMKTSAAAAAESYHGWCSSPQMR
jgi:hypothetical protein